MKKDRFRRGRKVRAAAVFAVLMLLAVPISLTGCKKEEALGTSAQALETEASAAEVSEPVDWKEATLTAEGSAERMVESGGYLFFAYGNAIHSINEATGEMKTLRTFEEGETSGAFWVYKGGLYYDSSKEEVTEAEAAGQPDGAEKPEEAGRTGYPGQQGEFYGLYRMDLETGEEEHLADLMARPTAIYASGDVLYIRGFHMNIVYALDENGKTKGELSPTETVYGQIPDGCMELFSGMLPYYVEHCGYMPVQNENCLVIADADGSNPRKVDEITNTSSVLFAEDCFFAMFSDGSGQTQCWRYEADTLEKKLVFESLTNPYPVQYRDGILYYMESKIPNIVGSETDFCQVAADVKTAGSEKSELVVSVKEEPGMTGDYTYFGNFYAAKDAVYCQQFKDYGIYIGKVRKAGEEAECLEPVLYQSPIQVLGHVEGDFEVILCDCGKYTAAQVYTEKMVFDGEGEAAEKMNRIMEERRKLVTDSVREALSYMDEDEEIHWMAENSQPYSVTFVINGSDGITYLDENYVCIRTDGYEYSGGAHGMPNREYFVFDRNSGERLTLADIVETPVEDLQKLVGTAFRKLAEETSFSFESPEDLEFIVSDSVSYDSPFFLTEEGVGFFYTPYEIAPYAAGFPEVVIPYEALDVKIGI